MGIGYQQHLRQVALLSHRCAAFSLRVVKAFLKNRGILLAGGVGYNVLLSTIPLLALLCVFLTHIVDEQRLLGVVALQAQHLAPAQADLLIEAITDLMDARDLISVVGITVLLFFSSLAFRMLEDAIAIIFHRPSMPTYRSFWVSALMPYIFILLLGAGLMMLTLLVGMATSLNDLVIAMWGVPLPLAGAPNFLSGTLNFVGVFLLLSALYKVLPVAKIAVRRALIGGFIAALLWEVVRQAVAYYFTSISLVNAVYGSMATLIVLLLSLEIGSAILLLGAQVIAELEDSARARLPWYVAPPRKDP